MGDVLDRVHGLQSIASSPFSPSPVAGYLAVETDQRRELSAPAVLDALRSGRVHLTGLRLLAPHLTEKNVAAVLAEATAKSTRQIEELVARLAPKPPVPTVIRKVAAQVTPEKPSPLFETTARRRARASSNP